MSSKVDPVLEVRNAVKHFPMPDKKVLKAVDGVSCNIYPGECLAVIGESGCGKSTLAKLVMGVIPMTSGEILLNGKTISGRKHADQRSIWREMQMIFQNAAEVVSPRMKIGTFLMEPWKNFGLADKDTARCKITEMLHAVRLDETCLEKYPHQLSGGELQRVCIARAFAMKPGFMVCDEITSALDVSVQADVLKLFRGIQKETGTSCMFICHDLALVHDYSDRVMVMYLGNAIEVMDSAKLGTKAKHPYTQALLSSIFSIGSKKKIRTLSGEVPSPIDTYEGCCFCSRCAKADDTCARTKPELHEIEPGHWAACHKL